MLDALAEHHEVWAIDLPGFGASPPLPEGERADIPALVASVEAFCAHHGLDRPHLAGNSTGGGIALAMAARGTARSVTAFAPIGFWSARERAFCQHSVRLARDLSRHAAAIVPALAATPVGRTLFLGQYYGRPWRVTPAECVASAAALAGAASFDDTNAGFTGWLAPADAADEVPVTIAWGDRDLLLLPRQGRRARRRLPRARHETLAGCGHIAMADDPGACVQLVLATTAG